MRTPLTALALIAALPLHAQEEEGEIIVPCGGGFAAFTERMQEAAISRGADPARGADASSTACAPIPRRWRRTAARASSPCPSPSSPGG